MHYLIITWIWITGKWQWRIILAKLIPRINIIIETYGKFETGCISKDMRIQLTQVASTS